MPDCSRLILPTRFCPHPSYYRAMLLHDGPVIINTATRFDKRQKDTHRCRIADVRGPIELTVPIAKHYGSTWEETEVSRHGQWWETFRVTLESAYGRTPYYEFFADEFNSILQPETFTNVSDLNRRFDEAIRRCLNFPTEVIHQPLHPSETTLPQTEDLGPYWQVRSDKFGYIPNLSILDILFNLGPETMLLLSR